MSSDHSTTPENLQEQFEFFKLGSGATLDDLDEQYHYFSMQLHNDQASLSWQYICEHQQQYDDAYYILLEHFIRLDCRQGRCERTLELGYDNVSVRRYDPGVSRRYFENKRMMLTAAKAAKEAEERDLPAERESTRSRRSSQVNESEKEYDVTPPGHRNRQRQRTPVRLSTTPRLFTIHETQGRIFDAPDNAVIIQAVNCLGVWGSGFAAELKKRFPAAYAKYHTKCISTKRTSDLEGFCFLIPPQPADFQSEGRPTQRRWIACLFTSVGYGNSGGSTTKIGRSDEETIVMNTDSALVDLRSLLQVARHVVNREVGNVPGDLYSPKFNSGSFGVPWTKTKELLARNFAGYDGVWNVVTPPIENE